MKLCRVHIQNFRGIKNLVLDLDDTTVLIGENNSGKTAVLDALRLCLRELGPRRRVVFDTFDFHLKDAAADPAGADPISITLTFSEGTASEWDDQRLRRLRGIYHVDGNGLNHVVLRVNCAFELTNQDFEQSWAFIDAAGQPYPVQTETALGALQREVAYFLLGALRDAAKQFDAKGPYWRPFLKDSQLPADKKADIEAKLKEVNDLVVLSHTSFDQVRDRLKGVQDVVPMATGDVVSIEAVPGRAFDMLSKAQIHLGTSTGAKVPVGRHGEGTQSLAVLMLFSAFLDAWPSGDPIVALEEPEAHLHPSAIRALWRVLEGIAGQKLVSTHSGDLLAEVDVNNLRRLARTAAGVQAFRIRTSASIPPAVFAALAADEKAKFLTPDETRKFNFHIRHARGELLFARCWLLVEGETEVTLLPEIARHLDINLEQSGVRCVAHRHASIELFLKVARDLGIRWCVLADNDGQGRADQRHAQTYAAAAGFDLPDVLHVMPEEDMEQHLCASGFGSVYQAIYDAHPQLHVVPPAVPACPQCGRGAAARPSITAAPGDPAYWPQLLKVVKNVLVKPEAAQEVMAQVRSGAQSVPPLLENAIRRSVAIAGGL